MSAADPTPLDDLQALHVTARSLRVSEYQVFEEAYRAWHGVEPAPDEIDALFAQRLSGGPLPVAVRQFTREYLRRHPEALDTHLGDHRSARRANLLAYILIVLMVIGALVAA